MALLISDRSGNSKMSRTFLNLAFGSASGIGGSERRMLELVHELKSRDINIRAMVPGPAESPLNLELEKLAHQPPSTAPQHRLPFSQHDLGLGPPGRSGHGLLSRS